MSSSPRSAPARPTVGRRRALPAGASLVVALALLFSQASPSSWLGRRLGGALHPLAGPEVLQTPCAGGLVKFLPPAVTEGGAVLPPLLGFEVAGSVRVTAFTVAVWRDADGDLEAGEGEVLREGRARLLPRDDGALAPDGWSVAAPAGATDLRFHARLALDGGDALGWQGEVRAAAADDARR